MSLVQDFPPELLFKVFDHVGDKYQEIVNIRRVSHRFQDLIDVRINDRAAKRRRTEDEETSQDIWKRCSDTFAARKRNRLPTDTPPRHLILPYFAQALRMNLLQTLVLTEDFLQDISLDWLGIHCTQVTSFELPHDDPEEQEMERFLQRCGPTMKSLKMTG